MKTRNRKTKGFTLVELLVVISIIGMLIALLLPAVQAARETARQNTCRNNLKNIALALFSYETNRNGYPGWTNNLNPSGDPNDVQNQERSWAFVILPYLDNRALYDKYRDPPPAGGNLNPAAIENTLITESLELFVCPTNPPEGLGTSPMSYVVNTGQIDVVPSSGPQFDYKGNGVFHNRGANAGTSAITMSGAYLSGGDGTSTTLMASENADAFQWHGAFGGATPNNSVFERFTGFTYHHADATPGAFATPPTESLGINVQFGQSKATGNPAATGESGYARASAYHPDIVNVAFCDGRVRPISETISYGVFQALMTPRGRAAVNNSSGNLFYNNATAANAQHWATRVVDEEAIQ